MSHNVSCLYNKGSIYREFDLEQCETSITKAWIPRKENNIVKAHINLIYERHAYSVIIDSWLAQILVTLVSRLPEAYHI